MGWFGKKPEDSPYGYVDNAALKGIGGYEPADPADATPEHVTVTPHTAEPASLPRAPEAREAPPKRTAQRKRTKAPFGVVILLTLVGSGIGFFRGLASHDDSAEQEAPPASTREAPPTREPEVVVPPAIQGWQSVPGGDGEYAYDVPPSWTPAPSTMHGWEADETGPGLTLVTSAFTGEDYCPDDSSRDHGGSGLAAVDQADPVKAASDTATAVARYAYTPDGGTRPELSVAGPQRVLVTFGGGARKASLTVVDVTANPGSDTCMPDRALVAALALESDGPKSPVLVAYADQGYPGATTREQLSRLVRSLRWVPEPDRSTIPAPPTS